MKARDCYGGKVWEFKNGVELVDGFVPEAHEEYAMREVLCKIVGRMLDHMNLTDQQKLEIVAPHKDWEIVE